MAHHIHTPAQVEMAVRWNRPAILLVRPPNPAAISFVGLQAQAGLRRGDTPLTDLEIAWRSREAILYWIRFHKKLLEIYMKSEVPAFVLAPFYIVLNRFEEIIETVNERFGLDIPAHPVTAEDTDRVFASASYHLAPSQERDAIKEKIADLYERFVPVSLQKQSQEIFDQIQKVIRQQRADW